MIKLKFSVISILRYAQSAVFLTSALTEQSNITARFTDVIVTSQWDVIVISQWHHLVCESAGGRQRTR